MSAFTESKYRTKSGKELSSDDVERMADEADACQDPKCPHHSAGAKLAAQREQLKQSLIRSLSSDQIEITEFYQQAITIDAPGDDLFGPQQMVVGSTITIKTRIKP